MDETPGGNGNGGVSSSAGEPQFRIGRWTEEEHLQFLEAYRTYGKRWKKIAAALGTRSNVQCRTHFLTLKQEDDSAVPGSEESARENENGEEEEEEGELGSPRAFSSPPGGFATSPRMYVPPPNLVHLNHASAPVYYGDATSTAAFLASPLLLQHQHQQLLQQQHLLQQQQIQLQQQLRQQHEQMAAASGYFNVRPNPYASFSNQHHHHHPAAPLPPHPPHSPGSLGN